MVTARTPGMAIVVAKVGPVVGRAQVTVTNPTLVQIVLSPSPLTLPRGLSHQLTATGVYADGSALDLTADARWTASNDHATVSAGLVTALKPGKSTLRARFGGQTGSLQISITNAELVELQVEPSAPSLPKGLSQAFRATGIYQDGTRHDVTSRVTWSSEDPAVGTIAPTGLALAQDIGSTAVRASLGGISTETRLEVTPATLARIEVTDTTASLPKGLSRNLIATGV